MRTLAEADNRQLYTMAAYFNKLIKETELFLRDMEEKSHEKVYMDMYNAINSTMRNLPTPILAAATLGAIPGLLNYVNEEIERRRENGELSEQEEQTIKEATNENMKKTEKIIDLMKEISDIESND